MDSTSEQLAKLYPRCKWAEDYLKSLEHGDSNAQFTPAIYIESNNVSGIKFGSRTSARAKTAKDISQNRGGNWKLQMHLVYYSNFISLTLFIIMKVVQELESI